MRRQYGQEPASTNEEALPISVRSDRPIDLPRRATSHLRIWGKRPPRERVPQHLRDDAWAEEIRPWRKEVGVEEEEVHDLQSLDAAHDPTAYDEPTTQQIPTYQERQEPEYQTPAQHLDGSAFGGNRPVRPSEMKEEG